MHGLRVATATVDLTADVSQGRRSPVGAALRDPVSNAGQCNRSRRRQLLAASHPPGMRRCVSPAWSITDRHFGAEAHPSLPNYTLRHTETCFSLSEVNGLPSQSSTRLSSSIPASCAIRSHSAGQM